MARLLVLGLALFLLTGHGSGVLAAEGTAAEVIAVDEGNPPFMYAQGEGAAGLYPALIREAFRRMGVAVDVAAMPWKRALAGIDAGENGVGGIYQNAERLKHYDYSEKLFDEVLVVYTPSSQTFPFTGIDSLKGKRVGVIRGWSYGDDFDAAVKAGTIITEEVQGDAQNFSKLSSGRLDAVIAISESAAAAIASGGISGRVTALEPPFASNAAYLAFAKPLNNGPVGKGDMLARFNAALASMRADGSYAKIIAGIMTI